jgi:nucleoid DNA-binding protein
MTKPEFLAKVKAANGDPPPRMMAAHVESVFDELIKLLLRGERFSWRDLGTFKVVNRPARKARNPQTGATIEIPARRTVVFRPARTLKERLNKQLF